MRPACESVIDCIGNTPMVRLNRVMEPLQPKVWAKLDFLNPGGSLKDRLAVTLLDAVEKNASIRPGATLIEVHSGTMGVGMAMAAAVRGYRAIFVVPDKLSVETRAALRAYGARVVITPANVEPDDPRGAQAVARRLAEETPNSVLVDQYCHAANPLVHYSATGPEIWEQMEGRVDVFVNSMDTGGSISGIGRFLREKNPEVKIIGVDPVGSVLYDYFHTGQLTVAQPFMLEGIGNSFLPETLDLQYVDDVFRVNDKEAFQMTRRLVREEGLFVGGASGAVVAGAARFLRLHDQKDLNVVCMLPDSGSRYLSRIFDDNWMRENGLLEPDTGLGTVRDLLKQMGPQAIITVEATARVPEVIGILKLNGISQVPVVRDGRLVGILTENRILERALRGGAPDTHAADLVQADYCTVDQDTEITVVLDLFRRAKVAVVLDLGRPSNIITRIDLIDYISKATAAAREV